MYLVVGAALLLVGLCVIWWSVAGQTRVYSVPEVWAPVTVDVVWGETPAPEVDRDHE